MTEEKKAIPKTLGWLDRPVMVDLADHTSMGCAIRDLEGFQGFMVVEGPDDQPYLINRDQIVTIHPAALPQATSRIQEIKTAFPEDLRQLLEFTEEDSYIQVTPRQFLGSENFAEIADVVRNTLQGKYVSQGKNSHFRIPKQQKEEHSEYTL